MTETVIKIHQDDVNTLILFSFRYAITRETEAFGDVCKIIKKQILPHWMNEQIIRDCERSIKFKIFEQLYKQNEIECLELIEFLRGRDNAEKAS